MYPAKQAQAPCNCNRDNIFRHTFMKGNEPISGFIQCEECYMKIRFDFVYLMGDIKGHWIHESLGNGEWE